jgi:anti-sigma factor RsiW
MLHESYLQLINLVIDGAASKQDELDLRAHLRTCSVCSHTYEDFQRIDALFKVQPEATPSRNFTAQVMAKVTRYNTGKRWYPWFVCIMLVIVVAALASTVFPFVVIWFGLYRPLLTLPVIGPLLSFVGTALTTIFSTGSLLVGEMARWLDYLLTQPAPLAVVISALMVASIWIGMLEVSKSTLISESTRQAA